MARLRKRTVIIEYVGREPKDPMHILKAVEEAFGPENVQIRVSGAETDLESRVCNEVLETNAARAAMHELDEAARAALESPPDVSSDAAKSKRSMLWTFLASLTDAGFSICVKETVKAVWDKIGGR